MNAMRTEDHLSARPMQRHETEKTSARAVIRAHAIPGFWVRREWLNADPLRIGHTPNFPDWQA
jgi:hypothetical protein